jgi:hypothetical protein
MKWHLLPRGQGLPLLSLLEGKAVRRTEWELGKQKRAVEIFSQTALYVMRHEKRQRSPLTNPRLFCLFVCPLATFQAAFVAALVFYHRYCYCIAATGLVGFSGGLQARLTLYQTELSSPCFYCLPPRSLFSVARNPLALPLLWTGSLALESHSLSEPAHKTASIGVSLKTGEFHNP